MHGYLRLESIGPVHNSASRCTPDHFLLSGQQRPKPLLTQEAKEPPEPKGGIAER
tara:strand:+ start:147 stop:311 length:165 start_codon:yes stop_codon:yes gene_type:complete